LISGILVGVILSLGTDEIFHLTNVYPPWGQTMSDGLFRLAPDRPMGHAMILGVLGLVVGLAGAVATWNHVPPLGPHWYAVVVALISIPCAWIGGKIYELQLTR
jgi:hypothetical protein